MSKLLEHLIVGMAVCLFTVVKFFLSIALVVVLIVRKAAELWDRFRNKQRRNW